MATAVMTPARFSIGIDLGTTNSAMAFAPLAGDVSAEIFLVPQWESFTELAELRTLPSFLYLPEDAVAEQILGRGGGRGEWIVGRLARRKAAETPGRVAHSAKSWLCHHAADRSAPFLPWGSDDVSRERKISPVRASALILNYLRSVWDTRFAAAGPDFAFDAQLITVTVPASFDAAAQRLTLAAARDAGFPDAVRLLEEPQAAFYNWLDQHDCEAALWHQLADKTAERCHVLVVDIGGGTSDFSLFELERRGTSAPPKIRRVAVSDHILLGGDNIDLALARLLEARLAGDGGSLSGAAWEFLVARCRDLKERALADEGTPEESFTVAIPGRGSSLIAASVSARLSRTEIEALLLDGFYPECPADARPHRPSAALKEWGLPYAADSAVTRHLADFLKDRPSVDAVLFNGGSLYPARLRLRLAQQIGAWQQGREPLVLENREPDLAVARGAACFGQLLHARAERIAAGAARSVFLEAQSQARGDDDGISEEQHRPLVCLLPRGAAPEQTFEIADLALELRLNSPVNFQTYYSTRDGKSRPGDVVRWNDRDYHALPPLQTVARIDAAEAAEPPPATLPVALSARMNELGLLQVSCYSIDPIVHQSWPLDFNLRPEDRRQQFQAAGERSPEANAPPDAVTATHEHIAGLFAKRVGTRDKLSAARAFQDLEKILGVAKGEWNGALVRNLWGALNGCEAARRLSPDHEETWLILCGYLLRPGFGVNLDETRIDAVWRSIREHGLFNPGKRVKLQEYVLWRRLAGGLSRDRQERLLVSEIDKIRRGKAPSELIRLAGSLERIGPEGKGVLARTLIEGAASLAREHRHCAPYFSALALMLSRTPLYAGPETVVSPDLVEEAYTAFADLDWTDPEQTELQPLFLRAARVVDNRSLDVPKAVRNRIAGQLEKSGVAAAKTARLREFVPVERVEQLGGYGESLPPGLILSSG